MARTCQVLAGNGGGVRERYPIFDPAELRAPILWKRWGDGRPVFWDAAKGEIWGCYA